MRDLAVATGIVVTAVILASCGQGATTVVTSRQQTLTAGSSPSDGASPPTPSVTPDASVKPPMAGLLDRQGLAPDDDRSAVTGVVVEVAWSDLQPSPGTPIAAGNAIDRMLATVRELNSVRADRPLSIKLRIDAGIHAPMWAKRMGGAPIPVTDPTTGVGGTVGRFWSVEFGRAYADLESRLAARYDLVPEIREVTISRCTTVYDEPFIRDHSDPATTAALLAAGLTESADLECLREQIDAHTVWHTTRSGLAFNPYQDVLGGDGEAITEAMMDRCRSVLGIRCVLENNSLRFPPQAGDYTAMYAHIRQLGPPISFQTAAAGKVGDVARVIDLAAGLGASAVELPRGYGGLTPGALAQLSTQLVTPH